MKGECLNWALSDYQSLLEIIREFFNVTLARSAKGKTLLSQ